VTVSDSARSTTAAESRFRLQSPNAQPRLMLVAVLDPDSAKATASLANQAWHGVVFVDGADVAPGHWPEILAAADADVVMLVASTGHRLDAAREIGNYSMRHGIKVSAVLLTERSPMQAVSDALQALRPWTRTLTLLEDTFYLHGLLHALGN